MHVAAVRPASEDAVPCEQPQDAAERVCVQAGPRGDLGWRRTVVADCIGGATVRDYM
jgi:hypothetical protein